MEKDEPKSIPFDIEKIKELKIHPAIGIARIGNSPTEFFIGPEIPNVRRVPRGGYKDSGDLGKNIPPRIKRQAVRFRIYAYDKDGNVLGEVTRDIARITWKVHVMNKKAEWDKFEGLEDERLAIIGQRKQRSDWRNPNIEERDRLIIDPGPRILSEPEHKAQFDGGKFFDVEVPLGHAETTREGHLLVFGGFGNSSTVNPGQEIQEYANNDFWHDDVSDGPVTAEIKLNTRKDTSFNAKPAWVIVTPPDFAPSVTNLVTLYDVIEDCMIQSGKLKPTKKPSFQEAIFPILKRTYELQWVQEEALKAHGPAPVIGYDFFAMMEQLADRGPENYSMREKVFKSLRNPNDKSREQANSRFMPFLSGDAGSTRTAIPERWFALTKYQYKLMEEWKNGNFVSDYVPKESNELGPNDSELKKQADKVVSPSGLDRASLEATAGGPFLPGIEGGWIFRNPAIFSEPFRLDHTVLGPGDVTKRMACPWQADFYECRTHWWPAQRPDQILSIDAYEGIIDIDKRILTLNEKMISLEYKTNDLEMKKKNMKDDDLLRYIDTEIKQIFNDIEGINNEINGLLAQRGGLWAKRLPWARGLAPNSPSGDNDMVKYWSLLGFVSDYDGEGNQFYLPDDPSKEQPTYLPQKVEISRGKYDHLDMAEYYHILVNIENYPDFLPIAKKLALDFLSGAGFNQSENYSMFQYSPSTFDARMEKIYNEFMKDINREPMLETGIVEWPVVVDRDDEGREKKDDKKFWIGGPFSDLSVKERVRQFAAFNLVDGAWLQNILSTGPADEVQARLFAIWSDEAGNGQTELNHPNVYQQLLKSFDLYMPPITSREFIEQDFLPGAFTSAVFQLSVGLFPQEFFPELLGLTLYLEWEATPTLTPLVRMFHRRYMNPQFYRMHVAIDNITAGHGALAKEAVKLYLDKKHEEGGDAAVQEHWKRIWTGYVTWATLGGFGMELIERWLVLERKQIDIASYILEFDPFIKNDIGSSDASASKFVSKIKSKRSPVADRLHLLLKNELEKLKEVKDETATNDLENLLDWISSFNGEKVPEMMKAGLVKNLNRIFSKVSLWDERVFASVVIDNYTRVLIEQNPSGPWLVELNRRLLQSAFSEEINEILPDMFPDYVSYFADRMQSLIRRKAPIAKNLHRERNLQTKPMQTLDDKGNPVIVPSNEQNLASLFDTPVDMLLYIAQSHWANLDHPNSSEFFNLLQFQGPMYKIFNSQEIEILRDWFEVAREWLSMNGLESLPPDPLIPPVIAPRLASGKSRSSRLDPIKQLVSPREERALLSTSPAKRIFIPTPLTVNLVRNLKTETIPTSGKPKSSLFQRASFAERRRLIGLGAVH